MTSSRDPANLTALERMLATTSLMSARSPIPGGRPLILRVMDLLGIGGFQLFPGLFYDGLHVHRRDGKLPPSQAGEGQKIGDELAHLLNAAPG